MILTALFEKELPGASLLKYYFLVQDMLEHRYPIHPYLSIPMFSQGKFLAVVKRGETFCVEVCLQ